MSTIQLTTLVRSRTQLQALHNTLCEYTSPIENLISKPLDLATEEISLAIQRLNRAISLEREHNIF